MSKKRQLLFTILFCLGFIFVFWADIFQYDKYMPEAKDIKSVQIDTYLFDNNAEGGWDEHKDWLTGETVDDALAVIKDIRQHTKATEDVTYTNDFTVTYELKNGTEKQRRYSYYGNEFPESLDKLSATEDFKDDFCILYHPDDLDITSISVANGPEHFELTEMTDEDMKELCEIYLKEYTEFTITEYLSKQAVFELIVEYPVEGKEHTYSDRYKVFADFTETISYLKKYNVVSFADSQNIKLENLEIYSGKYGYDGQQYISDADQLNQLKQYMILGDFMHYHLDYGKDYVSCTLRYIVNGNTRYMDVYLRTTDISKVLNP